MNDSIIPSNVSCVGGPVWWEECRASLHGEREDIASERGRGTVQLLWCLFPQFLESDAIEEYMKRIEKLKEEELERKKTRRDMPAAAPTSSRPEFASVSD